jgi:hypothetical protein
MYTGYNQIGGGIFLAPGDGVGIVQLNPSGNGLIWFPNTFFFDGGSPLGGNATNRLAELRLSGNSEIDVYSRVFAQALTFGRTQSSGTVGPVVFANSANGINTINVNQSAVVYDIPIGGFGGGGMTIITDNPTVNLYGNTLTFASGNLVFQDNITLNTAFNSAINPNTGGNITVNYDGSAETAAEITAVEDFLMLIIFIL